MLDWLGCDGRELDINVAEFWHLSVNLDDVLDNSLLLDLDLLEGINLDVDGDDPLDLLVDDSVNGDNHFLLDWHNDLVWLIDILVNPVLGLDNPLNGDFYYPLSDLLNVSLRENIDLDRDINLSCDRLGYHSLDLFVNVDGVLDVLNLLAEDINLDLHIMADLVVQDSRLVGLDGESLDMSGVVDRLSNDLFLNNIVVSLLDNLVRDLYYSSVDNVLLDDDLLLDVVELLDLDNLLSGHRLLNNSVSVDLLDDSVRDKVFDDLLFLNINVLLLDDRLLDNDLDDLLTLVAGPGLVIIVVGVGVKVLVVAIPGLVMVTAVVGWGSEVVAAMGLVLGVVVTIVSVVDVLVVMVVVVLMVRHWFY